MIEYQVRKDFIVVPLPDDDFERIPCWEITRVSGGWARSVAKYATQVAAENVAAFLRDQNRQGLEVE